jgi:integrase
MGPKPRPKQDVAKTPRRRRLTATRIVSLESDADPYDVFDPDMPGLQLHVGAHLADGSPGTKSWQFRFRWRGHRPKMTLGTFPAMSQKAAHDAVRAANEQIAKGIDPRRGMLTRRALPPPVGGTSQIIPNSVEHLADEFFKRHIRPRLRRPEQVERLINVEVLKTWRTRDARAVAPREVVELLDAIVDRGSRTIANDLAAYLSQMFRFGIQRGLVDSNPVQLLFRPGGEEKPRNRALSDTELGALLSKLDDVFKRAPRTANAIRIALYTACRRGELAGARWSELSLEAKEPVWRIPPERAKTGVEYIVPLVPAAVTEFKELKRAAGRSPYVLPAESGDGPIDSKLITRSIARHLVTLRKIGVKEFVYHDLRRTCRTGLAQLKIPPHIAERCLNHAQPGIVATYDVHQYLDEKREALEKWALHLGGLRK